MNKFRQKVLNVENICGTHVSLNDPVIAEIMGYVGFDYLWLDLEHTHISLENVYHMINNAKMTGTPSVVRVPQHDFTYTKKIMEMGPDGIIFPMVRSFEEAKELIAYTLYPPAGVRGCGPNRAIRYGMEDAEAFFVDGNESIARFIQIEHYNCVNDLEKIIEEIPQIDGYIIGPCDLAGSINCFNDMFGKEHSALINRAVEILKKHKKTIGISYTACDEGTIKRFHDMGINMISSGADFDYILNCSKDTLERFKKIHLK